MTRHHIATMLTAATGLALITGSAAACCPDIGHVTALASTGLGGSYPQALNLSLFDTVRVSSFQKESITYLQVSDLTRQARTAIGWIEQARWIMPIGTDLDRTEILPVGSQPPANAILVYEGDDTVVHLRAAAGRDIRLIVSQKVKTDYPSARQGAS